MRFEHLATGATTTLRGRIITTTLDATSGNYSAAHRLPCLHAFPDLPPRGIDEASCAREDNHEEPLAMAAGANALGLPFLQEACVLSLLLVLLVLWLVLVIALAAWTIWFSGYLYSEPTGEIYWRAPAAGAAVLFALVVWVWTDYRSQGRHPVFWSATESADKPDPYKEIRTLNADGVEEVYYFHKQADGKGQYRTQANKPLTARPQQILVYEGDEKITYEPDRDAKGNFKPASDGLVHYRDQRGRELVEGAFYARTLPGGGSRTLSVLVLHVLLLIAWFLAFWLLLRFQWAHALGQALVLWAVMLMFVMPPVLSRAEEVAKERAVAKLQE
jgi:hypothetical protein